MTTTFFSIAETQFGVDYRGELRCKALRRSATLPKLFCSIRGAWSFHRRRNR